MRRIPVLVLACGLLLTSFAIPVSADSGQSDSVGLHDPTTGLWYLLNADRTTSSFYYGNPGDFAVYGDWDCDGVDTPGLYRRSDGFAYLRNSNTQGNADVSFYFGNPDDVPLAGDFNNDGCDTVSIWRPSQNRVYVINKLGKNGGGLGAAEFFYTLGQPGDQLVVGDFNGDGFDTVSVYAPGQARVFLHNTLTAGPPDASFAYGNGGADLILASDWTDDGIDTVGVFRQPNSTFYLRFANTRGSADAAFTFGNANMRPVSGNFASLPERDDPPPIEPSELDYVTRDGWGAVPADISKMTTHTIDTLTVHHAGDQSVTTGPPRYRSWQAFHISRDWGDLAYHFIIGVDGTVYEARDTRYEGSTGTNYDPNGHFLVVVEGNFETDVPTQAQLDSLVTVLAWAATEFDVSPSTIGGHRDHAATACPGGNLYPYIASGDLETDVRAAIVGQSD